VFEKILLKRILGPTGDKVTETWRNLQNELLVYKEQ